MKNTLKLYGNKHLKNPTQSVTTFGTTSISLAERLRAKCRQHNGLGLAANQLGFQESAFTFLHEGELKMAFNPLLKDIEGYVLMREGCLSFPGMYYDIGRAELCVIAAQDEYGDSYELELKGWPARCVQHESEHLLGVTMLDKLNDVQLKDFRLRWPKKRSEYLSQQR